MLVYLACPTCGRLVLVCDEIGNVFDNLSDPLNSSPLAVWRSEGNVCPGCKGRTLASFDVASEQQLLSAGLQPKDFTPLLSPGHFSLRRLASV